MATKKITQLPAASAVIATDLVPIVDDPSGTAVTQKATWSLVRDYVLTVSGGTATIAENLVTSGTMTVATGLTVTAGGASLGGGASIGGSTTLTSGDFTVAAGKATIAAGSTTNALIVTTTGAIQQSLRYDGSNRMDVSVSSAGAVTYNAVGASAGHSFSDPVTVNGNLNVVATARSDFTGTVTSYAGVWLNQGVTTDTGTGFGSALGFGGTLTAGGDGAKVIGVDLENMAWATGGFSSTEFYGIRIPAISGGGTNYSIYAGGGRMYNAGEVGFGTLPTATSYLTMAAGTTARSSLRIPHGVAPTSPVNGDMWTTTAGLFIRINGSTIGPLS